MRVKVNVHYLTPDGKKKIKSIDYMNPNVYPSVYRECVEKLYSLTNNNVEEVYSVINQLLDNIPPVDVDITPEDIKSILTGEYTPVADDDPITNDDINKILTGEYTPVEE